MTNFRSQGSRSPNSASGGMTVGAILVAGFLVLWLFGLVSCTDASGARRVLTAQGYTDIQITGYRVFGCDAEGVHTAFVAKGPTGIPVTGVVCSGFTSFMGKSNTVRID